MHSLIWCSSPRRSDEADDSPPTTRGIPIGMNTAVMNFESHGVRVLMSISDASFPSQWNNGFGADFDFDLSPRPEPAEGAGHQ